MTVHLKLAGSQQLLSSRQLLTPDGSGEFVVDARELRFVSPLDLTAITALAHAHDAQGDRVRVRLPSDPAVVTYLERMDLLDRLPERCQIDRVVRARGRADRSDSLLEIIHVKSAADGEMASNRVFQVACANLNRSLAILTLKAVAELIDNAATHGKSETGSFVAAQIYPGGKRLEFAVSDTGIGVLDHLRGHPDHRDLKLDHEALTRAIQPGVTGVHDIRGNGLPCLLKIASRAGRTRLVIRSGNGLLQTSSGVERPTTRSEAVPDPVRGTWAWLRVRFP